MSIPNLYTAQEDFALIALYKCDDTLYNDTIYLTKGSIKDGGYQYYSEAFFAAYHGVLNPQIQELNFSKKLVRYIDGEVSSLSGISNIPKKINCLDSKRNIVATFRLVKRYEENIEKSKGKNLIRGWQEILHEY